jgi:hypothetical protein
MSIKVTVSVDNKALAALVKQINNTQIEVGWLDNVDHWNTEGGQTIKVPMLASHLHFHSKWDDSFMFSQTRVRQVDRIVSSTLNSGSSFRNTTVLIGKRLHDQLRDNILSVTSPHNDPEWAAHKGNNKPLQHGSLSGSTPNLISSISSRVKSI